MCLKLHPKERTLDKAQSVNEVNIRSPQTEVLSVVGISDKAEKYKIKVTEI
jgi:hypothetical protein